MIGQARVYVARMPASILVINCGSSSLKFALVDPHSGHRKSSGTAERLGSEDAFLRVEDESGASSRRSLGQSDHEGALAAALGWMREHDLLAGVEAVGHRVVHGGAAFTSSQRVTLAVREQIERVSFLAPLHNRANLSGIVAAQRALPELPQVAVFDTAFHQTLSPHAYRYAVPESWHSEHGVRKYGFHGTSYRFVAQRTAEILGRPLGELSLIIAHLGNGASACAIVDGRSVDTTMGLTPLSGLVMGTRSGDVDPGAVVHMAQRLPGGIEEVSTDLNRNSGLLGLSGLSNDMRTLLEAEQSGNERARLAVDVFCYRLAVALAGLGAALPRLHALVFTGGIGEHAAPVRERVVGRLWGLGVECDQPANSRDGRDTGGRISSERSAPVFVVPTDEEWMIAKDTVTVVRGGT